MHAPIARRPTPPLRLAANDHVPHCAIVCRSGIALMITIKDIAESVGVAPSTVARALADHPHVHEETKARIREKAAQLGYVAHAPARADARRARAGSSAC